PSLKEGPGEDVACRPQCRRPTARQVCGKRRPTCSPAPPSWRWGRRAPSHRSDRGPSPLTRLDLLPRPRQALGEAVARRSRPTSLLAISPALCSSAFELLEILPYLSDTPSDGEKG